MLPSSVVLHRVVRLCCIILVLWCAVVLETIDVSVVWLAVGL